MIQLGTIYLIHLRWHDKYISAYIIAEPEEDEQLLACLLMVFVAVSIPKLARNDNSFYRASLEGHANNIHCIATAVNNVFGALFTICGQGDIEDRMKEFLAVSIPICTIHINNFNLCFVKFKYFILNF